MLISFAWVSNDSYHLKPKEEGTRILISDVSVACYGWLETIEPKQMVLVTHVNTDRCQKKKKGILMFNRLWFPEITDTQNFYIEKTFQQGVAITL